MQQHIMNGREFDKIAASRMRLHNGGLLLHEALSDNDSIRIRRKLKRLGLLHHPSAQEMLELTDLSGFNRMLQLQPLGVRYATVQRSSKSVTIFSRNIKDSFRI